jgi:pSer/pThr/pTyr-binding forkhead associated (FHA) protein
MITEALSRFPNLNIDNCSDIRIEPASRAGTDSNDKFEFEFLEAVSTSDTSRPASLSTEILVTVQDTEGTREYPIESFPGIVGREGSGADIPVYHAGVSRSHLRIEADGEGRIAVTDTDSRNGTYYDGKLMKCGTKYQISAPVAQFTLCIGRTCSPDVARKNALSGDNSKFPSVTISMPQAESQFTPLVESGFTEQATPLVSLGDDAVFVEIEDATGRRIVPIEYLPVVMGRECGGIIISGKYPSREHLEIVSTSDTGVVIRDIGSSNGTYLQGARLSAMEEHSIPFDTLISFGPEEHSANESPKLCFRRQQ